MNEQPSSGIGAELGALRRWWWVPVLLAVAGGSFAYRTAEGTPPTYRSTARLAIAPIELSSPSEVVEVTGVLDGPALTATLAEVVTSARVAVVARAAPELAEVDVDRLEVDAVALPDSNVVEVSVEGPSAKGTSDAATVVGQAAAAHFQSLYTIYRADLLDGTFTEAEQVGPAPKRDGALGGFAGAMTGVVLAALLPARRRRREGDLDDGAPPGTVPIEATNGAERARLPTRS